jgi:signal transduction histidine kinase
LEAELIEAQRQIEGFRQREGEAAEAQLQAEARYQLEAELQSMRQQLEAQALSDANLRLESEGHQQQEFQLRRELELTRAELRKLSERAMTMGPESEGASPEAQEALEALRAELAEKSRELLAAQSALATTRNEIADQAKSLVVIREMLSKREKQLADLRATRAMPDEAGETGPSSTELKELLEARERQLAKAQAALSALQEQMQSVTASTQTQIAAKDRELVEAQAAVTRLQEISPNFEALRAQVAEKEKQLEKAQEVMTKLSRQVQAAATAREELLEKERQVTEAQAALTRLQEKSAKELAAARAQLAEGEKQSGADAAAPPSLEVIASLTQDLRQPMSSIVGYSDMLLGEKAGILGELQKKFLERIIASCERMEAQLDDLIRVTAIDSGRLKLARDALDVLSVVDEAVMSCRAQFREKGINLRLDIEDDLPSVVADREALREILTHLLNNAGSASTIDGEVVLTVRRESEQPLGGDPIHYLFVSMQDSGGGIALSDQPRVFSRLYRADAPLIAGLGDTGVGLSIAKALVEAQGGRIWLTSEIGRGSTFSVLLPADMRAAEAVAGNGFEPVQAPSPEPSRA